MTQEQKQEWLRNATADELLRQYAEFHRTNEYGRNDADLALTKDEIIRRMGGGRSATNGQALTADDREAIEAAQEYCEILADADDDETESDKWSATKTAEALERILAKTE